MNYMKPEIAVLTSAAQVIQSGFKDSQMHLEVDRQPTVTSAYEADE
jgi:hypothetical protein